MTPPAAGVVLAGGASARMGAAKAAVPWGDGTLLSRAVIALRPAVGRVIVVRAPGQVLPPLPGGVAVTEDAHPGRGPLEGLAAGLAALRPGEVAFALAVDMPFAGAEVAAAVLAALPPGADAAVPRAGGRAQPLAAAYRPGVADVARGLVAAGRPRMHDLLAAIRVAWVDAADLPGGAAALANVNTPDELAAARRAAGRAARQAMREYATTSPAATPPGGTIARASAPVSDVTAWEP
ncbi:MAG TPA: molybdenum cofactor guanylyltransferase [Miltoncostaeaceae bacterium]|jgi:molybdopterin-guanine dinucleotide biosynthesis protein A|nr:molybdenum cofactor guanylyltransferase [Miltoncostaeaceae bacterium]